MPVTVLARLPAAKKPPYWVSTVSEVQGAPRNGLKVASTFAGGGGSCFGYQLAGYEVVWASEIVPAAVDTYRANHPATILDTRDIRLVQPEDILAATGLNRGELDILDGSPPCQAFSTAGKREEGWGKVTAHADGTSQVSDDLFFEFARLVEGVQPRVFVAENVSGLVKGTAKGYFKLILVRLRSCGYRVEARVLDAKWLGVPQSRQRLIFIGVREDLKRDPVHPSPLPYFYSIRDALPELTSYHLKQYEGRDIDVEREPAPCICIAGGLAHYHHQVTGISARVGSHFIREDFDLEKPCPTMGAAGQVSRVEVSYYNGSWIKNYDADKPAPTILAGEQSMRVQRRKLTIAELKRLCGFPDDYLLTGSYQEQWARLGNAVPPPMMAAIASVIRDRILHG